MVTKLRQPYELVDEEPVSPLYRALEQWKARGHSISHLLIEMCAVDEEFVQNIREGNIVGNVEWDGGSYERDFASLQI